MQRRGATVLLSALALAATPVLGAVGATQSGPPSSAAAAAESEQWYVALGDSLAAGYQPGQGDDKTGGYVGGVLSSLREKAPSTQLKNFGCSGEDTTSITTGSRCQYQEGPNQLAAAESFLKAHKGQVKLITFNLGANDVQRCVKGGVPDFACLTTGLDNVKTRLPGFLKTLRDAAPDAQIVVANYYNPFLAAWLTGASGQNLAKLSAGLADNLNGSIAAAAKGVNGDLADVSTAFDSHNFTLKDDAEYGNIPTNVSNICTWTHMCSANDIHANDTGYALMAKTVSGLVRNEPTPTPTPSDPTPSPSHSEPQPTRTPVPMPTGTATGPIVQTG